MKLSTKAYVYTIFQLCKAHTLYIYSDTYPTTYYLPASHPVLSIFIEKKKKTSVIYWHWNSNDCFLLYNFSVFQTFLNHCIYKRNLYKNHLLYYCTAN